MQLYATEQQWMCQASVVVKLPREPQFRKWCAYTYVRDWAIQHQHLLTFLKSRGASLANYSMKMYGTVLIFTTLMSPYSPFLNATDTFFSVWRRKV